MKHPYYIVSPRYIRTSAGVKVLYRLCDLINKSGGSAFIYLRPSMHPNLSCSPMDIAPFLTEKIAQYHFDNGLTPIVIYPENFDISLFNAPFRVRYLLNYSQLLFSNNSLDNDDYLIAYSENILNQISVNIPFSTLFLPVSDPIFYCPPAREKRHGAVFYAGKYKYHFGEITLPITDGLAEITRDEFRSQTPEEIRRLFQESEFFYCYEDSALALEAMLCGCPTIFIPNDHFRMPLAQKELLGLGYAWGVDIEQIEHAKKTVGQLRNRYLELIEISKKEVNEFIYKSQDLVKDKAYLTRFAVNEIRGPSVLQIMEGFIHFLSDLIRDKGLLGTLKIIKKRIASNRLRLF